MTATRGRLRAVLYDWDGTLVDSAEKSYRAYVEVFRAHGLDFDRATFEATYSPEWTRTYRAVGLPEERWEEADRLWIEIYAREPSRLLPGVAAALERVRAHGRAQGVVSSGDGGRVRGELESLGVARFFGAVVCAGEAPRKKPHPDPLLRALSQLALEPAEAAYVGDSPEDVQMARAAGCYSVGVPGGFPNREALRASSPDLLADRLESAVAALLG
jgi:HAD superfamily hydrolase (TIGR01509 family)